MKKMKKIFDNDQEMNFETMSFGQQNQSPKDFDLSPLELPNDDNLEVRNEVETNVKNLDHAQKMSAEMEEMYQEKIHKSWSLMERWTDKSMYEKVQRVKEEMFQLTGKQRLTLYDLLLQSRIQQTKEKYDSGLKSIKSYYRRHVASYIMHQMESLTEEIKGYQFRFLEMQKSKYQYATTLKDIPSLHDRYMKSLFMQEERYLMFLDKLLMKFENVVSEELTMYRHK
jgi:hypothetical protein